MKNAFALDVHNIRVAEMRILASGFSETVRSYGIVRETCAEAIDFREFGIGPARCIDARILEKQKGAALNVAKDKNQRSKCCSASNVDIGAYQSCPHGNAPAKVQYKMNMLP